eukprot:5630101-Amphidinium_carterae.1
MQLQVNSRVHFDTYLDLRDYVTVASGLSFDSICDGFQSVFRLSQQRSSSSGPGNSLLMIS